MTAEKRPFGVTAYTLKIVAVVTMFLDHFAVVFGEKLYGVLPFLNPGGQEILRMIGRIAFPLFAFMIAEGASRTKSIGKYLGRLLLFAAISEVPFDLALFKTPVSELLTEGLKHQNVFFTLFLGLLCIFLYDKLKACRLEVFAFVFLLFAAYAAENWLNTDYGAMGVIGIFLYYIFLHAPNGAKQAGFVLTTLAISVILAYEPYLQHAMTTSGRLVTLLHMDVSARLNRFELYSLFSLPLILLYNGEKGRQPNKWFFYAFYPGHLLVLWGVYRLLFH